MIDLNMNRGNKRYFLEVTQIDSFKLIYFEKYKNKDKEELERKTVVGEYSSIFTFLQLAKYRLADAEGVENLNDLLVLFTDIQTELQKKVIAVLTKDKDLKERILKKII